MFDPTIGRWTTPDPKGFEAADANLFRYVHNNPTNFTDPSGLYEDDVHFYMTYYIAAAIGLHKIPYLLKDGKTDLAYVIAWAATRTDYHPATEQGLRILFGEGTEGVARWGTRS